MDISSFLPLVSIVISLCLALGGFLAYRQGYTKMTGEIQERVISALQTENETLDTQIKHCEKEIQRLNLVISTIRHALSKRGISIIVNGDYIDLQESSGGRTTTIAIQTTNREENEA